MTNSCIESNKDNDSRKRAVRWVLAVTVDGAIKVIEVQSRLAV